MKRILRWLPLYSVAAGVGGAFLQSALYAAMDDKGLLPEVHPAIMPLTLLIILSAVVLLLSAIWGSKQDFRYVCKLPVQAIGCLAAAAGCVYLYAAVQEEMALFAVLKLLGVAAFAAMAVYRLLAKKPPLLLPAMLSLIVMLLCFGQYRQWGRDTQLLSYLLPALSALFTALYSLQFVLMELPERNSKKTFVYCNAALFCSLACMHTDLWPYYLALSVWLLSGLFTRPCAMKLPGQVQQCIQSLEKAGYQAYVVGGCVRDAVLGLTPHDYDLCTNATPEQICQVFQKNQLVRNGEKHGTIGVVIRKKVYEITTFRTEGSYSDNRHPDSVTFVDRVEQDLARRDFTVNAMAYHPQKGYIDPYGGIRDLLGGTLRAVGDPRERFQEDALRILRGVRFACRFKLEVEPATAAAMEELAPLMDQLARERVYSELTQILCAADDRELVRFAPIVLQVIPELQQSVGFDQHNPHHQHDVYTHTAKVLAATQPDPALRWAALLHDVGKPQTFTQDEQGRGHFYGHAQLSGEIAQQVLQRMKAPNELKNQVVFLVEHHMDELSADKALLRRKLSKYGSDNLTKLICLQQADMGGKGKTARQEQTFEKMLELVRKLEQEEGRLQIRDLAINGNDLMALGYPAGPQVGKCQKELLRLVLNEELPNTKQALSEKALELLNKNL